MKLINTQDAEGMVLCHDITRIIKGVSKGVVFKKGHVVTREDIPVLLSVGKDSLYVWENDENMLHENDAAEILLAMCFNDNMEYGPVSEGKIEITAACDGLFKVDNEALKKVNSLGQMMIATRHGNFPVKKSERLAGMRIIPLVIEKEKMNQAKSCIKGPILQLKPFTLKKAGVITTGNEVFYGRIEDTFTPVITDKLKEYNAEMIFHEICDDNPDKVTAVILKMIESGADMVICTGGMSVDPDDRTPLAIKNTGAEIISYGAPVLPGAMFMLAYYDRGGRKIPVMGLPGCVMYAKRTVFDLVLPRIMADDMISAEELSALGQGGMCLNCPECRYPLCGFGKGM